MWSEAVAVITRGSRSRLLRPQLFVLAPTSRIPGALRGYKKKWAAVFFHLFLLPSFLSFQLFNGDLQWPITGLGLSRRSAEAESLLSTPLSELRNFWNCCGETERMRWSLWQRKVKKNKRESCRSWAMKAGSWDGKKKRAPPMLLIPRLFSVRMRIYSAQTWNALSKHNQRWQDEDGYIYSQMENKSEWQREKEWFTGINEGAKRETSGWRRRTESSLVYELAVRSGTA